jgi:peptide/nickel transport system permease protein
MDVDAQYPNPVETKKSVRMQLRSNPVHARFVSFGAFLMIVITIFVIVDLFLNVLAYSLAYTNAGFDNATSTLISLTIRLAALGVFGLAFISGVLGYRVYVHRTGRILQKLLLIGICLLVLFAINIGIGLLLIFSLFLWAPRFTVSWSPRNLTIYRALITGAIVGIMLAELMLTSTTIGITLVPQMLTLSLSQVVTAAGQGWLSLTPLFLVFPLYLLLPRLVLELWNYRLKIELFWMEFIHQPLGMLGLIIIGTIVAVSLLAPFLAPYPWGQGSLNLEDLLQPPSPEHLLGTNQRGEDIYSRLLYGGQISLLVGFTASIVSVLLGTAVGLISGYFGGLIDSVLMRITDVFLCLPTLPLMLIFLVLFGQGLQNVIVVIAILGWTGTARMVRSEALSLRERPLTEAAHALGATDGYIILHHVMPNTLPLILANTILGVVNAILNEAGIAFLGFVDIHGQPSWGIILHWAWKNAALLANRWWWFIPPGLLIMLTTLGFVFISHATDKVVNPRLRKRRQ